MLYLFQFQNQSCIILSISTMSNPMCIIVHPEREVQSSLEKKTRKDHEKLKENCPQNKLVKQTDYVRSKSPVIKYVSSENVIAPKNTNKLYSTPYAAQNQKNLQKNTSPVSKNGNIKNTFKSEQKLSDTQLSKHIEPKILSINMRSTNTDLEEKLKKQIKEKQYWKNLASHLEDIAHKAVQGNSGVAKVYFESLKVTSTVKQFERLAHQNAEILKQMNQLKNQKKELINRLRDYEQNINFNKIEHQLQREKHRRHSTTNFRNVHLPQSHSSHESQKGHHGNTNHHHHHHADKKELENLRAINCNLSATIDCLNQELAKSRIQILQHKFKLKSLTSKQSIILS